MSDTKLEPEVEREIEEIASNYANISKPVQAYMLKHLRAQRLAGREEGRAEILGVDQMAGKFLALRTQLREEILALRIAAEHLTAGIDGRKLIIPDDPRPGFTLQQEIRAQLEESKAAVERCRAELTALQERYAKLKEAAGSD